jgi:hypothetical protein
MPLVEPVTTAAFPTSSPVVVWGSVLVLLSSIDASCWQVIGAAHGESGNEQANEIRDGRASPESAMFASVSWHAPQEPALMLGSFDSA